MDAKNPRIGTTTTKWKTHVQPIMENEINDMTLKINITGEYPIIIIYYAVKVRKHIRHVQIE